MPDNKQRHKIISRDWSSTNRYRSNGLYYSNNLIHLGIVYEHLTRGMPAQDEYHVDHCVRRLCHANTCGLKGYGEEVL